MTGITDADGWAPRFLTPVDNDPSRMSRAEKAIEFIELFGVITKDSVAGQSGSRLHLMDWQKNLIRAIYLDDGVDPSRYQFRLAHVMVPRKNGKSALASHLAIFDTIFGGGGAETYSVASTRDQARIVFNEAKKIIQSDEELTQITKIYRDAIEVPSTGSVYRVLSAEAGAAEGLNSTSIYMDETHSFPNRKMFDVMQLSMAARGSKAHMVSITTAGVKSDSTGRDSIAFELYNYGLEQIRLAQADMEYDQNFLMACWTDDADHRDPESWKRANPGFGVLNDPGDFEASMRRTPEAEFRTKRMNQFLSGALSWLPAGAWEACEGGQPITPDDEIILGFDGSFSGDCTALVACTVQKEDQPIRVEVVKLWERDPDLDDEDWRVDIADVEQTIIKYCQDHPKVIEIACDPFRWQRSMQVLQDMGLPVIEYPSTSPRRMVASCAKFFDMVMDHDLVHDGNPAMARHLSNAVVKQDNLGPRIVKESRSSPRKIDLAVAGVIAVDRATVARMEQVVPQFFG